MKLNGAFAPHDAHEPLAQNHVWTRAEATDETQCYDETKPESFVSRVFGRTLILLTCIQAFSFTAIYGTAVAISPLLLISAS